MVTLDIMKYTKEQRDRIKAAFTPADREKLKKYFMKKAKGADRQYVNGLRRTSPERAKEIAAVIGRNSIIKVLLPNIFGMDKRSA